jgi:hypothetical protein
MTKRTSTSYVCTLDVNSVADMQVLETIRKTISISNNNTQNKKRVVVRGRKPIQKKKVHNHWTGKTGFYDYDFCGNIVGGIANATKLDVYIYNRCN